MCSFRQMKCVVVNKCVIIRQICHVGCGMWDVRDVGCGCGMWHDMACGLWLVGLQLLRCSWTPIYDIPAERSITHYLG
jgi:hypothetical protein